MFLSIKKIRNIAIEIYEKEVTFQGAVIIEKFITLLVFDNIRSYVCFKLLSIYANLVLYIF